MKYANTKASKEFELIANDLSKLPFHFTYDGIEYCGIKNATKTDEQIDGNKRTLFFSAPLDELEITAKLTHYYDYGVSEWTVWFENKGTQNSKILSNVKTTICAEGDYPTLKGIMGDRPNKYTPYSVDLNSQSATFTADTGRATHVNFPYFNLEIGTGGIMFAIGWAGNWTAEFCKTTGCVCVSLSGVNGLNTYLKPNEKIRTPLFVVAPYLKREEHYATNFWRSWYIKYTLPKANGEGEDFTPQSTCCLASDTGLPNSDGSISERHYTWRPTLEKMFEEKVKVDFRWFDAGWYIAPDLTSPESNWWGTVGTWVLDENKWPGDTFRQSTDFARENGMKTLMWFEPERITDIKNMVKNFGYNPDWAIIVNENTRVITNNIGNDECRKWTTDRICKVLRENRVEMYREDNNSDPAMLWKFLDKQEGENREGITECKFIDAHYKMWDDIIECTKSYGGCAYVDSCASGGGRNDIESMRRGIPLLRSDADRTSTALRLSMTTAFNKWIPCCGANTKEKKGELDTTGVSDTFVWRCSYLPFLNVDSQFVQDPNQNFDILRFGLNEWKEINRYLLKDFYTLTPWRNQFDTFNFTSFAYFDENEQRGVLFAFRQENCEPSTLNLRLPWEKATLTDKDTGEVIAVNDHSVSLTIPTKRCAKIYFIEQTKNNGA